MVTKEIADASAELIEILKYVPEQKLKLIPINLINFFKKVANPYYIGNIDPNKPLDKQLIKEKTKDLITIIYREYWCNTEERKQLDIKLAENEKNYKLKYNADNIFATKKEEKELLPTPYKKNFFFTILEKIKHFFIKKEAKR